MVADWGQIEDPSEVHQVEEMIREAQPLDVYTQAELYDAAYPGYPGDKDFYVEYGRQGSVLYLGSGSGRIFGPIAESNPNAVGVDISSEMVTLMKQKFPGAAKNTVLLGDASTLEYPNDTYDVVMAPYSFLQVIPEESLERMLQSIRSTLKPGGRFVTDTFSSHIIPFRRPGIETMKFSPRENIQIQLFITYNHIQQTMREIAVVDDGATRRATEMHLQYYFPRELARMLKEAGLTPTSINGDYSSEPFDPARHDIVVYEAERSPND